MAVDLISIITPVYNTEKYLPECIESVMCQSDPNWELILVDDGSTDNSGDICNEYSKADRRIRVYHKENTGQFDSRMLGIINATGDYCTGLDSDDYIEPEFVKTVREAVSRRQTDILCWNIRSVCDNVETAHDSMPFYGRYSNYEFLKYVIISTNHSFCNKLIRTDLLRRNSYKNVPIGVKHSEDYILICPAICMAGEIYAIDSILYNYRQLNDSVTHSYSAKRVLDYLDSSEYVLELLDQYNMRTNELEGYECRALISAIGNALKQSLKTGKIDREQMESIRNHTMFNKLIPYEHTDYISIGTVILLKMFRYHLDGMIRLMYRVVKHA